MEIGLKGSRKVLILLDQNFNSTSREVFTVVRLKNCSIPKDAYCPLKCGDNLVTQPFEALAYDLVGFTIDLNFFPKSGSIIDLNGKRKGGRKVDTSPMKCATSDLSKRGRETILQSKNLYQIQYMSRKDVHKKIIGLP